MADEDLKAKVMQAAREKLAQQLLPGLTDPRNRLRTVVAIKVLSLVDREIGKGEPRSGEEWANLKKMVAGQEGAAEMVANLESAVASYADELAAKVKSGEVDEPSARAAAVKVIRLAVLRKIDIGGAPPTPA
jgi:hypothetical protein